MIQHKIDILHLSGLQESSKPEPTFNPVDANTPDPADPIEPVSSATSGAVEKFSAATDDRDVPATRTAHRSVRESELASH